MMPQFKKIYLYAYIVISSTLTLYGMAPLSYFNELQPTHDALVSINNILRKYHQKDLKRSHNQTICDGEHLKNILIKNHIDTLHQEQQAIIFDEILGLLLYDLFYSGHYKDTITYINTLIPMLPDVSQCLVFIPNPHLEPNALYTHLEKHWNQLLPHQQLVFHVLLSISSNNRLLA